MSSNYLGERVSDRAYQYYPSVKEEYARLYPNTGGGVSTPSEPESDTEIRNAIFRLTENVTRLGNIVTDLERRLDVVLVPVPQNVTSTASGIPTPTVGSFVRGQISDLEGAIAFETSRLTSIIRRIDV